MEAFTNKCFLCIYISSGDDNENSALNITLQFVSTQEAIPEYNII